MGSATIPLIEAWSLVAVIVRSGLLAVAMVFAGVPFPTAADETPASLKCDRGPVRKSFGGTPWLVYGCDDRATIIIVSAPGSIAMPFYFAISPDKTGFRIVGEGTGSKAATDAAYREISALSPTDITTLRDEVEAH